MRRAEDRSTEAVESGGSRMVNVSCVGAEGVQLWLAGLEQGGGSWSLRLRPPRATQERGTAGGEKRRKMLFDV